MTWSRRRVLTAGGALAGMSAAGLLTGSAGSQEADTRRIALWNINTDERLDIEYLRQGAYLPDALAAIDALLRDFRTGERHVIAPSLMDYLVEVAQAARVDPAFSVISGYRREKNSGVAQRSLHMEGRAIDVRVSGVDCAILAAHAENLRRGGVGYYRASNFIHLDTGAFRTWKG